MHLKYGIFARYIELGKDDTYTMVGGGFTGLSVPSLPFVMPTLAIVASIVAEWMVARRGRLMISRMPSGRFSRDAASSNCRSAFASGFNSF